MSKTIGKTNECHLDLYDIHTGSVAGVVAMVSTRQCTCILSFSKILQSAKA